MNLKNCQGIQSPNLRLEAKSGSPGFDEYFSCQSMKNKIRLFKRFLHCYLCHEKCLIFFSFQVSEFSIPLLIYKFFDREMKQHNQTEDLFGVDEVCLNIKVANIVHVRYV